MIVTVYHALEGDIIVAELRRLGVHIFHLVDVEYDTIDPTRLLASMSASDEARLSMALVVLFLEHPEFCVHVEAAAEMLAAQPEAEQLRLYYQAAVYLQREVGTRGKPELPDLYSQRFGSPRPQYGWDTEQTNVALDMLAAKHALLPMPFARVTKWRNGYRKQLPLHLFKVMAAAAAENGADT